MSARTYPVVDAVERALPLLAQERLRGLPPKGDAEYESLTLFYLDGVLTGMSLDPAKVVVDLERMQVTIPIERHTP